MLWSNFFLLSTAAAGPKDPNCPWPKALAKWPTRSAATRTNCPTGVRWIAEYSIAGQRGVAVSCSWPGPWSLMWLVGRAARMGLEQAARRFDARRRELLAAMCRALAQASGFFFLVVGLRIGINFLLLDSLGRHQGQPDRQRAVDAGGRLHRLLPGGGGRSLAARAVGRLQPARRNAGADDVDQLAAGRSRLWCWWKLPRFTNSRSRR